MNPLIIWLGFGLCGVIRRDSILVFDEKWNIRELWKTSEEKRLNSSISGQNRSLVPVPNKGGTGTTYVETKWYRYHLEWYRYHSPEPIWYRYQT